MRADLGVCHSHEKGVRHKQKSEQELTWKDINKNLFLFLILPREGFEPRVFGFEFRRATTELRPPVSARITMYHVVLEWTENVVLVHACFTS